MLVYTGACKHNYWRQPLFLGTTYVSNIAYNVQTTMQVIRAKTDKFFISFHQSFPHMK